MAHTKILFRQDVDDLGARGEIVRVRAGYARNYLLPRKLAVEATANNVKQIEQERAALLKKEATERATAEGQAEQLGKLVLEFKRKAGEQGALYGSVTSMDIDVTDPYSAPCSPALRLNSRTSLPNCSACPTAVERSFASFFSSAARSCSICLTLFAVASTASLRGKS